MSTRRENMMRLEAVAMVHSLEGSTRVTTAVISRPISSSNSNSIMTAMIFLRNTDTVNGRKRNSKSRTIPTKATSRIIGKTKKNLEIAAIRTITGVVKAIRMLDGVTTSRRNRKTHSIDKRRRR